MNHYNRAQQRKRFMDINSTRKSIQAPSCTGINQNNGFKNTLQKRTTPKNFQSVWKNKTWHKANIAAIWDLMQFSCTCSSELFSLSLTICGFAWSWTALLGCFGSKPARALVCMPLSCVGISSLNWVTDLSCLHITPATQRYGATPDYISRGDINTLYWF